MPWALLLDYRVWMAATILGLGLYAATQKIAKEHVQAEYAQFRADVESEASKAKVKAAQEAARQAQNAQGVLDDLQSRYAALNARYRVLRSSSASSSPVPSLSTAAPSLSTCPGEPSKPNPLIGRLDALEAGILEITGKCDSEIAKYAELWKLQEKNAAR